MSKVEWQKHMLEVEDLAYQEAPKDPQKQKEIIRQHKLSDCKICAQRKKTVNQNLLRKEREDCLRSLGLEKVRGPVSGKIYWE